MWGYEEDVESASFSVRERKLEGGEGGGERGRGEREGRKGGERGRGDSYMGEHQAVTSL